MDESGAERMLRFFRGAAQGKEEDHDELDFAIGYLRRHGQSLDWILRGDPGGMIVALTAMVTPEAR
jgi:hypothetical protein